MSFLLSFANFINAASGEEMKFAYCFGRIYKCEISKAQNKDIKIINDYPHASVHLFVKESVKFLVIIRNYLSL